MIKIVLLFILLFILILSGCSPQMTNDEVIAEVKKCKDAGLDAYIINGDFGTARVECDNNHRHGK